MAANAETAGRVTVTVAGRPATDAQGTGRIGPNAVTRVAEALAILHGESTTRAGFADAGLSQHLAAPPGSMIDERDVMALHCAGRGRLGDGAFARVAWLAGQLTGDYILAKRIPQFAQRLLRPMPRWLASRVLGRAIAAHAWTFAGSGEFTVEPRAGGMLLTIRNSPLAREVHSSVPLCGYYTATFERIFARLVAPTTTVTEISCIATGAQSCRFNVEFD